MSEEQPIILSDLDCIKSLRDQVALLCAENVELRQLLLAIQPVLADPLAAQQNLGRCERLLAQVEAKAHTQVYPTTQTD